MFIQRSDRAASSTVLDTTDASSVRARVFYRERSRTAGRHIPGLLFGNGAIPVAFLCMTEKGPQTWLAKSEFGQRIARMPPRRRE